jgi:hypothetical protein
MGFMLPQGVMNEVLENKELAPFITLSSQHSEAPFSFQALPPTFLRRRSIDGYALKTLRRRSDYAGPHEGAGPSPAGEQADPFLSGQSTHRRDYITSLIEPDPSQLAAGPVARHDSEPNHPADPRQDLTALPVPVASSLLVNATQSIEQCTEASHG